MRGIFSGIISFVIAFILPNYATSIPRTPNAIYIKFAVFVVLWMVIRAGLGGSKN